MSPGSRGPDEDGSFVLRNVRGDLARYRYNVDTGRLTLDLKNQA